MAALKITINTLWWIIPYDEIMTSTHLTYYSPFMRVDSPHKGLIIRAFDIYMEHPLWWNNNKRMLCPLPTLCENYPPVELWRLLCCSHEISYQANDQPSAILYTITVYPKKYAHGSCFAVLCCGYTLTDFPISIRLTSLALWQSNDCPSASKATLMNMDKYFNVNSLWTIA